MNLDTNKYDNSLDEEIVPTPITERTNIVFITIKVVTITLQQDKC